MAQESWRDIDGFEGYYQVSNLGNVRSVDRLVGNPSNSFRPIPGKPTTIEYHKDGVGVVRLNKKQETTRIRVEDLVANAFLKKPKNAVRIRHKNGDNRDCRAENLEWIVDGVNEEWRPVVGYEGYYEVSSLGNMRGVDRYVTQKDGSVKLIHGVDLKLCVNKSNGYLHAYLCSDSKHAALSVHRIVANAFLPNPHKYPCVDHRNGNRQDNRVVNLRWCTYKQNMQYADELGFSFGRKPVMRSDGKLFSSLSAAAEAVGCTCSTISDVIHGRQKKYKGFTFSYA